MVASPRMLALAVALAVGLLFVAAGPGFLMVAPASPKPGAALPSTTSPDPAEWPAFETTASLGAVCGVAAVAALFAARRRSASPVARRAYFISEQTMRRNYEEAKVFWGKEKERVKRIQINFEESLKEEGKLKKGEKPPKCSVFVNYAMTDFPETFEEFKQMHEDGEAYQFHERPMTTPEGWRGSPTLGYKMGGPAVPGSYVAAKKMLGADVDLGIGFFDPMGFTKLYDRNFDFNMVMTYPHVDFMREAEIKHGRVCMMAFLGICAFASGARLYPEVKCDDWGLAVDAMWTTKTSGLGMIQIIVFIAFCEANNYPLNMWIGQGYREPGDWGWDPLKLGKNLTPEQMDQKKLAEIKNGRLAMCAVIGLFGVYFSPSSFPGGSFFAH